jgi:hypothetical protein
MPHQDSRLLDMLRYPNTGSMIDVIGKAGR